MFLWYDMIFVCITVKNTQYYKNFLYFHLKQIKKYWVKLFL